jgi:membrane-associated HD superfamily phosphohydrolase
MLATASRAPPARWPSPRPSRIESLVEQIARKRLMDGQFDQCGLTLAELQTIEESVIKSMCAVYHGRIKYPDAKDTKDDEATRADEAGPSASTHSAAV